MAQSQGLASSVGQGGNSCATLSSHVAVLEVRCSTRGMKGCPVPVHVRLNFVLVKLCVDNVIVVIGRIESVKPVNVNYTFVFIVAITDERR